MKEHKEKFQVKNILLCLLTHIHIHNTCFFWKNLFILRQLSDEYQFNKIQEWKSESSSGTFDTFFQKDPTFSANFLCETPNDSE